MPITISALNVYPVKGLKGIALEEARCTDLGIEHDRRWMVVDREGEFVSQREHPRMATIWTDIDDSALTLSAPDVGEMRVPLRAERPVPMKVQVWKDRCDAVAVLPEADQWLSDYLGFQATLVYMPSDSKRFSNPEYGGESKRVGFADGYAYLLIGEASLADLNAKLAARNHPALPMNRFRPNIVVTGSTPFAEDDWRDIKVGDAVLRSAKPCGRCQVPSTDQATGEVRGPEPLATLATYREGPFGVQFGMNLVTLREGTIRVGDPVELS